MLCRADDEFGEEDLDCLTQKRLHLMKRGAEEPVLSFADRLDIGCSLARVREAKSSRSDQHHCTRHRFHVSEEHAQRFSIEEVVIFKDLEKYHPKRKTTPRTLLKQETF